MPSGLDSEGTDAISATSSFHICGGRYFKNLNNSFSNLGVFLKDF